MFASIDNEIAEIRIQDGILFHVFKTDTVITLDVARKTVSDRVKLQQGIAYPVLCDIRGVSSVEKAARDYFALEGSLLIHEVAYLVSAPYSLGILNFFLNTNKPPLPTTVFVDEDKALKHLQQKVSKGYKSHL